MDLEMSRLRRLLIKFLKEGKKIENKNGPYTVYYHIPTQKNVTADLLDSIDQSEHHNYNQKKEGRKRGQIVDDVSPKEKDRQNKGKMRREFHNLESYIKQGKSPNEIHKSNLISLSRSTIFERCKRYKEKSSFRRKSCSGRKIKYIGEHI